jgi:hypothetical protein
MQLPSRRLETPPSPSAAETLGLARLAKATADPQEMQTLWEALVARAGADASDAGAFLDLSTLLLATGHRDKALEVLAAAVIDQKCFRRPATAEPKLRLLAFMTPGDFTANTPLDFLLEGSDVELISCYVDGPPSPDDVPEHDLAFLAIGQSEEAEPLLQRLKPALDRWPTPVLNNQPELISALTRDGVAARFAGHPHVLCPVVARVGRPQLEAVARGEAGPETLADGLDWPLIARPMGTHAGIGMEKLGAPQELAAYLDARPEAEFFVTAFVDYAGPDGLYRKLRIVFIQGAPFISHMAVSQRWMVHYLNADMAASEANRAEEAQMMAGFDEGFAARHAEAVKALCEAYPFDYFGIDCAEAPDGRLLVFEADVALIVHNMDPEEVYPYKKPAMRKLFAAFVAALERAAA